MRQMIAVAAVAALAAHFASADDSDYTAETGYVTAVQDGHWLLAATWSSGVSPVDLAVATNYYVGIGRKVTLLRSDDTGYADYKFPADGSRLVVAGQVTHAASSVAKPYYGDVTFLPGSTFYYNSVGEIRSGDFRILGTEASPVKFTIARKENSNRTLTSAANFHSDATGYMRINKTDYAGYAAWQNFQYPGDWSDFKGTFLLPKNDGVYVRNGFNSPGAFVLQSNSVLRVIGNNAQAAFGRMDIQPHGVFKPQYATAETTAGTLNVASGGKVHVQGLSAIAITVTNRLTLAEGAVVELSDWLEPTGSAGTTVVDVFKLSPAAVSAGTPDVSAIAPIATDALGLPRMTPCLYDDPAAAGGKIVGIAIEEYVAMTNTCLAAKSALDLTYNHPEEFWSDGQYPSAGKDYLLSAQLLIRNNENPYVFPGRSCASGGNTIGMYSDMTDITFTNLYVYGNSSLRPMSDRTAYFFRGNIYFPDSEALPLNIRLRNDHDFTLAADLHGGKDICVLFQDQAKPAVYNASRMNVTCRLAGNNVGYRGKICVATTNDAYRCSDGTVVAFDREHTITLRVTAPENLGGPLDAFAYDSLTLSNQCRLAIDATATFADTTRGWNFPRTAYLFVTNGATATCRNTLTIGGNLVKEGEGTLVLAAKPVADGAGASITVTNGTLAVGLSDALDGLPVSFAEGTSLGLDMSSADATFAAKGLALASTDITCASGGLVLSLCGMPANPEDAVGIAYPLLTYPSAQAAAVAATYSVRNPYPQSGYVVRLIEVPNGDDTVTLKANIRMRGTHLILR